MKILCPNGSILHSDASVSISLSTFKQLNDELSIIVDKQLRVKSDADFFIESEKWDDWIRSVILASKLSIRLANLFSLSMVNNIHELLQNEPYFQVIDKINTSELIDLPFLFLELHKALDMQFNENLADMIYLKADEEAKVLTLNKEQIDDLNISLTKEEIEQLTYQPLSEYLKIAITDSPGTFLEIYLPHSQEEMNVIYEIIYNANNQLEQSDDDDIYDLKGNTTKVLAWFNEVFSYYRLQLKILAYREIKEIEQNNNEFVNASVDLDSVLLETSEKVADSYDKYYFMLNKLSGFLNTFGYPQEILHEYTSLEDFVPNKSSNLYIGKFL